MRYDRDWYLRNGIAEDVLDRAIAEAEHRTVAPVLSDDIANPPSKRKPAHVRGEMNETEKRFDKLLAKGRWIEPVLSWTFEDEVLQLAPDLQYLPDFRLVLEAGGLSWIDCKNKQVWEDSVIKAKAAAIALPQHKFYLAQLREGAWWIRRVGVRPSKTIKIPA